ncbi:MAG: hypothetical protein MPJ50_01100 [Pirellulales bacterium]|nr:hypothetical protein [Pirellulales bacterium]
MSKFVKWIVAPAVLIAGLVCLAPNTAHAQGFSLRVGGGGYGGYGYGFAPRRSGVSFYYSNFPGYYRSYYAPRVPAYYYRAPVYSRYYAGPYCW